MVLKIVGVCACVAGIAHTYIAQEKLIEAAKNRGHKIKTETQGVIGIENELSQEDIDSSDVVILAVDVSILKRDRFDNKKVVEVPTRLVINSADKIIQKIEKMIME
ncbi:fructose PTS transporter subunit IIB [Anaerococcus sp. AGMB09787]|uniref:PTS fructose transporter subunit IIB n=1 Tax=Anaerococcus sp. AGMB09787 TaxID=2922869 RepID=UPI001FAF6781|nr:fructose PTS transporter subunit IIB [Anaerococcus sp. AGMB09787]